MPHFAGTSRPETAIALARQSGVPLRMAAKIPCSETRYYKDKLEPLMDGDRIRLVGELNDAERPRKGSGLLELGNLPLENSNMLAQLACNARAQGPVPGGGLHASPGTVPEDHWMPRRPAYRCWLAWACVS